MSRMQHGGTATGPVPVPGHDAPSSLTDRAVATGSRASVTSVASSAAPLGSRLMSMTSALIAADIVAWVLTAMVAFQGKTLETVLVLATALSLAGQRMYQSHLTASVLDQLPAIVLSVGTSGLVTLIAVKFRWSVAFAPEVILRTAALGVGIVFCRAAALALVRAARRHRLVCHRTLVLGGGEVGVQLLTRLREHPETGLLPVAVLDPSPKFSDAELGVPWLGDIGDIATVIEEHEIAVVVVAFSSVRESELVDVLRTCDRLDCEFFFVPRLFELQHMHGDMEQVFGMPLVRVRRAAFRTPAWKVKRLIDVVISAALLVMVAPVMAGVALAVRAEGGPGIIFRQKRVGLDGVPFTMLKFRSMRPVSERESQTQWNISHDARVGPVGRVIRKASLDELPQLWNVLRGDMSIVGPRPERPHFVDEFSSRIPRYTGRHRVPAGLTGLAAAQGLRGDTSIAERTMLDNYYIENWSLWLDAKILLQTVGALVRHPGS